MNCKPGDLAVVVAADNPENIGRIVLVLGQAHRPGTWVIRYHGHPGVTAVGPCWEPWTYDYELRPIRDNDGEDETLTWAGKPEGVPA
jgi:hypothetical protein